MPKTDIDKIIGEFSKGSIRGFSKIYSLYYFRIRHFAFKLVGDDEEAKDLAVESFLKLFENYQKFNDEASIRAFLYIATRNACFNVLKQRQRKSASHNELYFLKMQDEKNLDGEMISGEDLHLLFTSIEKLPDQRKKVIKMMYFEGKKISEIASQLGLSEQIVKNYQMKALHYLRSILSQRTTLIWLLSLGGSFFSQK